MTDPRPDHHDHDPDAGLDALLADLRHANERVEPPADLVPRIERAIGADTRRRRLHGPLRRGLAAAALVGLAAAAWWLVPAARLVPPAGGDATDVVFGPDDPAGADDVAPVTRVRFAPDAGVMARTVPTRRADVTIVMLYDAFDPPPPTSGDGDDTDPGNDDRPADPDGSAPSSSPSSSASPDASSQGVDT